MRQRLFLLVLAALSFALPINAQIDRPFSVPLGDLKNWSESVTVSMHVKITGHSQVHLLKKDCEMHFGAKVAAYKGIPAGWVLEPMNLCLEHMPARKIKTKADWEALGDTLNGKTVKVTGVPRIWPEHLEDQGPSNPAHATELHPLASLTLSNGNPYDFTKFIYAPDGLDGIKPTTAKKQLTDTSVTVREENGIVKVSFSSLPMIGNFAILDVTIERDTIAEASGGHMMEGEANPQTGPAIPVRLVTVSGSTADDLIAKIKKGNKKTISFEALVLFSLNPAALFKAAMQSSGSEVEVSNPIQLIVYGPTPVD